MGLGNYRYLVPIHLISCRVTRVIHLISRCFFFERPAHYLYALSDASLPSLSLDGFGTGDPASRVTSTSIRRTCSRVMPVPPHTNHPGSPDRRSVDLQTTCWTCWADGVGWGSSQAHQSGNSDRVSPIAVTRCIHDFFATLRTIFWVEETYIPGSSCRVLSGFRPVVQSGDPDRMIQVEVLVRSTLGGKGPIFPSDARITSCGVAVSQDLLLSPPSVKERQ